MRKHSTGARTNRRIFRLSCVAAAVLPMLLASPLADAGRGKNYRIKQVLVAEDQYQGERGVIPKPIYKPHETDATERPKFWISSNERGAEEDGEAVESKAGITILKNGRNRVLSVLNIEDACIPVVNPDGSDYGCAPPGAENHPRHPHGIDIDNDEGLAYQVIEHSGLQWTADRSGFTPAESTDDESALLVVYDIRNPKRPEILEGYVLGHGAEEVAVNEENGKAYVGNHEPSPTDVPCFVSVVDRDEEDAPYGFIDLPDDTQCIQGIEVDEELELDDDDDRFAVLSDDDDYGEDGVVFGTTHVGERMYAFDSATDSIAYSVDIRGPFDAQIGGVPDGAVLHMHDLTTDNRNHRAYQTIHALAPATEDSEETTDETAEVSGRWVAEVDTDPESDSFRQVTIIDLSNGQSAADVPSHGDATGAFEDRFVHAHFVAVDPRRKALFVTGEHTGNLGVVDTRSRSLRQVVGISRPIPGCQLPPPEPGEEPAAPEPHVHGVNVQARNGMVYVSDEGEDCFYESVTILR